jgi:hypothetical protein
MNKIFVYGYRHTGTTILRKIIGSHSMIYDYIDETLFPPGLDAESVVFKHPSLPTHLQDDCKRVMIMKNPWDVFGSLRMRYGDFTYEAAVNTLRSYGVFIEHFLVTTDLKVKYEDLFTAGVIEGLFESLGFEYEGEKDEPAYISSRHMDIPDKPPPTQREGDDHARWRTWQINQPLRDMTGESAVHLEGWVKDMIDNDKFISRLYDSSSYPG